MPMIERFYTDGHKIKRPTVSRDSKGAPQESLSSHLTVSGKLWQLSGAEQLSADKETVFATARFVTDIADIKESDTYESPDGQQYRIKAVAIRTRPDGTGHMELDLELVR